ncbi:MAG: Ppx/GppA phosphatase family protein [Alphaproteobacteria bacterium]
MTPFRNTPPERATPASQRAPVLAALDLGTNNCRLLIATPAPNEPQGFRVIDAFSRIVRLGEGLSRHSQLQESAIGRTLEALGVCQRKLQRHAVTHARAVATEACRRAGNGAAFLAKGSKLLGLEIEVIESGEEARLAMLGCAPLLAPVTPHAIMFDIGGGSTELIWLQLNGDGRPALIDHISVPCGVVSLTEEYGGDLVSDDAYAAMVERVRGQLLDFDRKHGISAALKSGQVQMVGSSGTVTTLAGVLHGLVRYQRSLIDGCTMQVAEARQVTERIRVLDFKGRSAIPCIGQERADLVVAGCAILQAIYETWPVIQFRVGDRGLREGILTDLLDEIAGAV